MTARLDRPALHGLLTAHLAPALLDGLVATRREPGRTVNDDFFTGPRRWGKYAGKRSGAPALIYGGDESYIRSGTHVISWRDLWRRPRRHASPT